MSDLSQFLITTGRTLSQMALYSTDHPSVKTAIVESHQLLTSVLSAANEIDLSISEGKLVVNGQMPEGVADAAVRPFIQLLTNSGLHSLTFFPGIEAAEMIPFFRLTSRTELKNSNVDVPSYLASQGVQHIKCNLARYAKISEDETVGGHDGASDGKSESAFEEVKNLSLNDLIGKLLEKSVKDPGDRARILERALSLVKELIDASVDKVVKEFHQERTKLTNERERTEGVVERMADGVVVVDESGKVIMMNPSAESIYGVKLGECLGKPLWEGVREEQMVALAKDLTVPTDRPLVKEVQIHGSEEAQKTLRASTAAVQDTNGRVVGMVSVLTDVTKQKELTRMQNEFMANVTHDLRAPVHAVKLAVGAILEGVAGPTTTEQNKMLSVAGRNVERLSRLIDDLLDFSKIESGAMEIRPQVTELVPLLQEATASLEAWSKSRGIALGCKAPADLPQVFADSDRVLQVVNNLISNAIKFTPSGGHVTLSARTMEDAGKLMAVVQVEDSGAGISKTDQARIFERFVQLKHSQKLDVRGTGLGLSICRAFVDLHKGRLWIESPPPGAKTGSLFSFSLPTVQRGAEPKQQRAAPVVKVAPKLKAGFWRKLFSKFKVILLAALLLPSILHARPYWGTVRRVMDAGLLQLEDGTPVRYLGIDPPPKGSPAYAESLAESRWKVEHKEVRFQYGVQERGADGVWLAYVFADGDLVNEALVRDGLALVAPLPNDEDYLREFLAAERAARREKKGLWQDASVEPYDVRAQKKSGLPPASDDKKIPDSK